LRVYGFTIDAASGGLATLPSMPVGTGVGRGIFSADGNVLFLPHDSFGGGSDGAIAAYSVHQPSGVLTSIGAFPTGGRIPASLALSADGALLFAPNAGAGTIGHHTYRGDSASDQELCVCDQLVRLQFARHGEPVGVSIRRNDWRADPDRGHAVFD
jgi:6-phosphogluconolactonase (cycloisomerase 2 family)